MHLLVPDLPYPLPIDHGPFVGLQSGSTIDVRMLPNDPRVRALMPGSCVTMVNDEDQESLIVLGKGWNTTFKGSVLRIPYSDVSLSHSL